MNQKYNPYVSLVALLLLALILVLTCTGCAVEAEAATLSRFAIARDEYNDGLTAYVITDTETGVQYLFVDGTQCGAMVKLEG